MRFANSPNTTSVQEANDPVAIGALAAEPLIQSVISYGTTTANVPINIINEYPDHSQPANYILGWDLWINSAVQGDVYLYLSKTGALPSPIGAAAGQFLDHVLFAANQIAHSTEMLPMSGVCAASPTNTNNWGVWIESPEAFVYSVVIYYAVGSTPY